MVSSVTVPMPVRTQAESSSKAPESTGTSFQDALQQTLKDQQTGPQEEPDCGKTESDKAQSEQEEQKSDGSKTPAQGQPQIFVIPGQENLVVVVEQGLAVTDLKQLEPVTGAQPEAAQNVTPVQEKLPQTGTVQELVGLTKDAQVRPEKELPVQAMDPKAAKQLQQTETGTVKAVRADAGTETAPEKKAGTETQGQQKAAEKTADPQEKHFETVRAASKGAEEPVQAVKEQPQPYLAAQAAVKPTQEGTPQQPVTETQTQTVFKPAQPETLHQELPAKLAESITAGKREFTIQLEPKELGKMLIKASFEDGKAVVSIACSNAKTLELLSSHAKDMGAIMESHMGTPTNVVVEKNEPDYLAQQQDGRQNQQSEQQRQSENSKKEQNDNGDSFLQQLRLGLV